MWICLLLQESTHGWESTHMSKYLCLGPLYLFSLKVSFQVAIGVHQYPEMVNTNMWKGLTKKG